MNFGGEKCLIHGLHFTVARPSLIHGLCAFFASNSRFMRLFQALLDTPLDSPFSATLSVHGLHFTVCAPSNHVGAGVPDDAKACTTTPPGGFKAECTAVAAIQLRMRMQILTRSENSQANFSHQISNQKLRIRRCEGIR